MMSINIDIVRPSKWTFLTFGGGGASFIVAGAGGTIILNDTANNTVPFTYAGVGAGLSKGIKLPKIGKIQLTAPKATATGSTTAFPSAGTVFVTANCPKSELTRGDFTGPCAFVEAGGGLIGGGSGMVMLAGMQGNFRPTFWESLLNSAIGALPMGQVYNLLRTARAVIPMAGLNVGLQANVGIAGYVGWMW